MEQLQKGTDLNLKARFFALYWGQKVMVDQKIDKRLFPVNTGNIEYKISDPYLELTPLSNITDEDAIELAKLIDFCGGDYKVERGEAEVRIDSEESRVTICFFGEYYGSIVFRHLEEFKNLLIDNTIQFLNAYDFLRSKDYALPWMGLSVEEQISYGWIKLKNKKYE